MYLPSSLTPHVSPSRSSVLSFTHYFRAPATQATCHQEFEIRTFNFIPYLFSFVSSTSLNDHSPHSITLFRPIKFEKWIFDFLQFNFFCVSSNSFDGQTSLNCKLSLCPHPTYPFTEIKHLNITVNNKKKSPRPPLPHGLSCSSGIGLDVADFHLLHDLFPLKGMWFTKLYKQPLYFELPPTLINTFLSTGINRPSRLRASAN